MDHRRWDGDPPCAQVVDALTAYLDGVLAPHDRALLERHLADCDGCRTALDQLSVTIALTGGLARADLEQLDEGAQEELLGVFRRWAAERSDQ